jgi:hypothetical protein
MSEVIQPIAEGSKQPVENKSMSDTDFLSARIAKLNANAAPKAQAEVVAEAKKPESEPKAEPKVEPAKQVEPKAEDSKPKDVLSKDIEDLTDDDIKELAERGKSGLLKRIAELTAKRKMAEEKATALEAMLAQSRQRMPEAKVENNPFSKINTVEELRAKNQEIGEVVEWAEVVLERAENIAADDVAATVDGKDYTKAEIRESLRNARKARDKFLPAQFSELQAKAQRAQMESAFKEQARKELSWISGEDNDTRKRFEAMVSDPRIKKMKESVPEIAPQIEYLVAHAANSIYGRKTVEMPSDKPKSPTLSPPSTPSSSAAASERAEARHDKEVKEVEQRFRKTGSANDFVALRTAQISKRQSK